MPFQLIRPNWHVALIHYPLALLTLGVLIEALSFFWRKSTVRLAARWMMLLGALALIPTVTTGLYAFRDVVAPGSSDESTWAQVVAQSRWSDPQWILMRDHILLGSIGTGVTVLAALLYLAASEIARQRWRLIYLALFLLGTGTLGVAAWHGGETVYAHGTAVRVHVQEGDPAERGHDHVSLQSVVPPMQLHVTLAGLAVALGLAAIAVTRRRFRIWDAAEVAEAKADRDADRTIAAAVGANVPETSTAPAMVFPARLWLVTFLLAAGTVAAGLWATSDWELKSARAALLDPATRSNMPRLAAHVAFGTTIVLLPLLLFVFTTALRRQRLLANILTLLLVVAIAVQVWLGILLLFDSMTGPVTGFTASASPTTQP